ncbi:MAG: transglycosylase SLT domain-containing protein [Gemmatimonadetes bacterium]|nr:transglycosylase SLT domain-containing protein [Gemmatimonadota bacterium]
MTEVIGTPERRTGSDRRASGGDEGRGRRERKQTSALAYVLRSLAAVVVLLFIIIFAVRHTRPVYASSGTVVEQLRKRAPVAAAVIAPVESSTVARLMASPKYQDEKRNFFEDLMRTGQLDSARADSIAQYAVREAYTRGISPAIVFGVMLTENARFVSKAMSNVGAVGLMQVYPKIWLKKEFSDSLGKDLASDSTNVRYGVFILDKYFHPRTRSGDVTERDYRSALLHYNGCVSGSNTPNCKTYPDKVRRYVEASAKSICSGRGFYDCIAKPFIAGLLGDDPDKTP